MNLKKNISRFFDVDGLRWPLLIVWSILVMLQALLSFTIDSAVAAGLVLLGGWIFVSYACRRNLLYKYPISTLSIIGFGCYYFILPPVATSLEALPLTNNLENPILVLTHAVVCLLSLLAAHIAYCNLTVFEFVYKLISVGVFKPAGFYKVPTASQIYLMGFIGAVAMVVQVFSGSAAYTAEADVGIAGKFIAGLQPLAYFPFVLLIPSLVGLSSHMNQSRYKWVAVYTVFLLTLAIGRNSRGAAFIGLASIVIAYGYGLAIQSISKPRVGAGKLLLGFIVLALLTGPVADFATAMVVTRSQRIDVDAITLISETNKIFLDKDALRQYKIESAVANSDWDEVYINNLFLARLANLKFSDQSIDLAMALDSGGRRYLRDIEFQRVISNLPAPVINWLNLDVDKIMVTTSSGGDLLLYAVTGSFSALGGFRTGSIFGSGYGMFGWAYSIVLIILAAFLFCFFDAMTWRRLSYTTVIDGNDAPLINPLALSSLFSYFFFFTSAATGVESMSGLLSFMIRGWIQMLFVYIFAYWLTAWLARVIKI